MNRSTTLKPAFQSPVPLEAGGKPISMPNWLDPQADEPSTYGPRGPTESIYGWLCPTMGGWDGDGDLDLFVTGQRWETKFFENTGSRESPVFAKGRTVTVDGLTDTLAWRSKVSIGGLNADGQMDLALVPKGPQVNLTAQCCTCLIAGISKGDSRPSQSAR